MMYGSWDMERNRQNFLSFWTIFPFFALLLTPLMDPENQKFGKMNNTPKDIIILLMCTINHSNMMYGSWDMKCNRHNFLSFWTIFCPFTIPPSPPNNLKNQHFQKMNKKPGDIIVLHMCTINGNHMMDGSWDMKCDGQNFLSFWTVFCLFTPLQKIKILKKWIKSLEISLFYTCVP